MARNQINKQKTNKNNITFKGSEWIRLRPRVLALKQSFKSLKASLETITVRLHG